MNIPYAINIIIWTNLIAHVSHSISHHHHNHHRISPPNEIESAQMFASPVHAMSNLVHDVSKLHATSISTKNDPISRDMNEIFDDLSPIQTQFLTIQPTAEEMPSMHPTFEPNPFNENNIYQAMANINPINEDRIDETMAFKKMSRRFDTFAQNGLITNEQKMEMLSGMNRMMEANDNHDDLIIDPSSTRTTNPTSSPTSNPTPNPTSNPTLLPTFKPTFEPTSFSILIPEVLSAHSNDQDDEGMKSSIDLDPYFDAEHDHETRLKEYGLSEKEIADIVNYRTTSTTIKNEAPATYPKDIADLSQHYHAQSASALDIDNDDPITLKIIEIFDDMSHVQIQNLELSNLLTKLISNPSPHPKLSPSFKPTVEPSLNPSYSPTSHPSLNPTSYPTLQPSSNPTSEPTFKNNWLRFAFKQKAPNNFSTSNPLLFQTSNPTTNPTLKPSSISTNTPTEDPTINPTLEPTVKPTANPTFNPTLISKVFAAHSNDRYFDIEHETRLKEYGLSEKEIADIDRAILKEDSVHSLFQPLIDNAVKGYHDIAGTANKTDSKMIDKEDVVKQRSIVFDAFGW